MTINEYLSDLEPQLEIPYPRRKDFLAEVKSNYFLCLDDLKESGYSFDDAKKMALQSVMLNPQGKVQLDQLHSNFIFKSYRHHSNKVRDLIEVAIRLIPTIIVFHYIKQEVPMMDLIQQGGMAMYPILAIGSLALTFQLKILFSWFIAKNHTKASLETDQKLPLILGAGCFLLGFLGTLLGLRKTFYYADKVGDKSQFGELLAMGASESIVNLIFATAVFLIIFALYFFIKYTARSKQIPIQA